MQIAHENQRLGRSFSDALRARELSDYDVVRIARDVAEALAAAHAHGVVHGALHPDRVMLSETRVQVVGFGGARQPAGVHADLSSLGLMLRQALAGRDVPGELAAAIARCLETDGERRFASASELAAALERVLPRLPRYAGKRMLIADDDSAIRRLFEAVARRERIACDAAANGPEAIAALEQREYALLFLDIMMPRIDCWGVLDYLRTRSGSGVPSLFIITAFLDQSVSAADRELVSGIIYKPVDADDIAALMRGCVRGGSLTGVLQRTRHRWIAAAV